MDEFILRFMNIVFFRFFNNFIGRIYCVFYRDGESEDVLGFLRFLGFKVKKS